MPQITQEIKVEAAPQLATLVMIPFKVVKVNRYHFGLKRGVGSKL
jgi:hypothetical protein